ncbi:dUTP diphosphatase, partial [Corynebacterium durum]
MGGFVRIVLGVSVNNDSHYPATIKLRRLDPDIPVPQRAHRGDAGVDLSATTDVIIQPGERLLVGTGIAIALPLGMVGLVHPRSGLAARHGLSI